MTHYNRREALRLLSLGAAGMLLGIPRTIHAIPRQSQISSTVSKNIPDDAYQMLQAKSALSISSFAFAANNGWILTTKDGEVHSRGIAKDCEAKVKELIAKGEKIKSIAFPPAGTGYVILTDKSHFSRDIDNQCAAKLKAFQSKGHKIEVVAFQTNRDNRRWVIVTDKDFAAKGIPDLCYQAISNLRQAPDGKKVVRKIHHIAMTRTGGWVVLADDYFMAQNIPPECMKQMDMFKNQRQQSDIVNFSPQKGGWVVISNTYFDEAPVDEIRTFEENVSGGGIIKRMKINKVPGVVVGVVRKNRLAWTCSYGTLKRGDIHAAHADSIFQAGSMSTAIATIGALRLVELGRVGLDDDLRTVLDFEIPVKEGVHVGEGPTLRQILGHRAGFNIKGLKGYKQGVVPPKLDQILKGEGRANNPKIQIEYNPDGKFQYSSGGFIFLDKIIEQTTGENPTKWLNKNVLEPMSMKSSTFNLKPAQAHYSKYNVASGHDPKGTAMYGGTYRYPESSASGLYTTAADFSNLIIMLNRAGVVHGRGVLTKESVEGMLTPSSDRNPERSLGLKLAKYVKPDEGRFHYTLAGANMGFRSMFYGYPNREAGVVVLSNGVSGDGAKFCHDVAKTVIDTYQWDERDKG